MFQGQEGNFGASGETHSMDAKMLLGCFCKQHDGLFPQQLSHAVGAGEAASVSKTNVQI